MLKVVRKGSSEDNYIIQIRDAYVVSKVTQTIFYETLETCGTIHPTEKILSHSYNPLSVIKAVSSWLLPVKKPWWYAFPWSNTENPELPPKLSNVSWTLGIGCLPGIVLAFRSL